MQIRYLAALFLGLSATTVSAEKINLCDFESYPVGTTFTIWNFYGSPTESTATVEADPANSSNKVLHVVLRGWNDYIEFQLPEGTDATNLNSKADFVQLDIRRADNDPCQEWKHFDVLVGSDKVYEDDGWPSYGPVSQWSDHTYPIGVIPAGNNSAILRLGFNSENTDYYIDNVILKGRYDDYKVYDSGKLDFSNPSSTSSSYTYFSDPIKIPAGATLDVYTSRYTYWTSPIIGEGGLNIHGAGERMFIGNEKGASVPDWTGFNGDITVSPWPEVNTSVKAGFYGVVLGHGGKKFDSDNIRSSITKGNLTQLLANNNVTLRSGATMAAESNNTARAFRIGSLTMEAGSRLTGYYKKSAYRVYYVVGALDKDFELAGEISPFETSLVGLVKEGYGTCRITGNNNNISGAVSVLEGRVLIDNDVDAARSGKLSGAVGTGAGTTGVYVYQQGVLGGSGHVSGTADIYGRLEPGNGTSAATLTFADFVSGKPVDLRLRPTTRMISHVSGSGKCGAVDVTGKIIYYNIRENLSESSLTPVIEIDVADNADLSIGDVFTLVRASGKSSLTGDEWKWRVQYPRVCTWEVTDGTDADGVYTLTAKVVSLDYSGQGDTQIIDKDDPADITNDDYIVDYTSDYNDLTAIREYAARAGKTVGVAVPVWRYNVDDDNDATVAAIANNFNGVVAENEMKFDALQPTEGEFNFGSADRLVNFAERHSMAVRGHTLVWYSQVPGWLTSDGRKNSNNFSRERLLGIMNSHIDAVVGHYKGRVREWDVVNECLDDNQSVVRDNPDAFALRTSVWSLGIGDDYVAEAFRRAHKADPDARLYINDYGVEFMGDPKSEALYNLVRSLVNQNVPIHGVGLQCHITTGEVRASQLIANIKRYKDLGLDCIITELDIAQADPKAANAKEVQARDYGIVLNAALSQSNCPTVMIWGVKDNDSWRQNNPLLFDSSLNPKDAFYAVHAAARINSKSSSVESVQSNNSEPVAVEYYTINGQRILHPSGLVIQVKRYPDGVVRTKKLIIKQ